MWLLEALGQVRRTARVTPVTVDRGLAESPIPHVAVGTGRVQAALAERQEALHCAVVWPTSGTANAAKGGPRCGAGRRSLLPSCVRNSVLQLGLCACAAALPLSPLLFAGSGGAILRASAAWSPLPHGEEPPPPPPPLHAQVSAGARGARGRSPVFARRFWSFRRAVGECRMRSAREWRGGAQGPGPGSGGSRGSSTASDGADCWSQPARKPLLEWTAITCVESLSLRHRTDIVCRVIFIVVILGYIALGVVTWVHGDPREVIYPTDSYGQFCSQKDTPSKNKTILFYFNILKCASPVVLINLQRPTTQLCVSQCPDRFVTYIDVQASYRYKPARWNYFKQFYKPGFNNPCKSVAQVLRDEDCPSMIIPSRPFLKRCFPDFSTKSGVLTVANQTTFKDGRVKTRNVTNLREAAKQWAVHCNDCESALPCVIEVHSWGSLLDFHLWCDWNYRLWHLALLLGV
ncbi:uncharacterized protein LOC115603094 [Strigops habroptila]|uniref:uncharacterized protein LOC115603094 n=1 Tax=Strigops habroptila TaxID=2489341 RepID=UPI0011CFDC6A|nr:uncharacterized protein LOC115603094 [Strigops habroptila]